MEKQLNSSGIFSQDFLSLQILQEIHKDLRKRNIEPDKFTDRIIFMSMFNDIDWTRKGNDGICISNSEKVKEYAKRFLQGHWEFLGPGDEKKCMELFLTHLKENGTQKIHVIQYSRVISALMRGILKMKSGRGIPYTSMPMLRTPSSCSESLIL